MLKYSLFLTPVAVQSTGGSAQGYLVWIAILSMIWALAGWKLWWQCGAEPWRHETLLWCRSLEIWGLMNQNKYISDIRKKFVFFCLGSLETGCRVAQDRERVESVRNPQAAFWQCWWTSRCGTAWSDSTHHSLSSQRAALSVSNCSVHCKLFLHHCLWLSWK